MQRAIDAVGLNQSAVARMLGWSASKVSRMISGKRCGSTEDVAAVLAVCGITGPKRDELIEIARHANEQSWWQEFGDRLPPELRTLSDYEDCAIAITSFETAVIPGLLQTNDYMTARLTVTPTIPRHEIEERVRARQMRRAILERATPARCRFFIDEYAVVRAGAGRRVMSDQVHHLLRMSVRPHIEIRVVPDRAGFHAGQHPFHLMEFTELYPVLHLENMTSVLFLERKDTVEGYRSVVAELSTIALDEGQSRDWLARVATSLGRPRKDRDAPRGIYELAEEFPQ